MAAQPPAKADPIIIVGAGIFGLSTAIHLAQRGYTNVTVFDKQPYEKTLYSYFNGCDAASADINKIVRSAYGAQTEYQSLSTEALATWSAWNADLRTASDRDPATIPAGMTRHDRIFVNNGLLSCTDAPTLPDFERATVQNMEAAGHVGTQLVNDDAEHVRLAEGMGRAEALNPFAKGVRGVLDTTGGFVVADRACRFAMHRARGLGVEFVLHPNRGNMASLVVDAAGRVAGIRTADGEVHRAEMTLLACGGWTPALLPELDGLAETTAGSVVMLRIPERLRGRFDPGRFPAWVFKMYDGAEGGLYGFPVDENGYVKIGYRGMKYTNPKVQGDGSVRSVPVTRWSGEADGAEKLDRIPEQAARVIRKFVEEYLPELGGEDVQWLTRICWYTDSFDNHFLVDRVPGKPGLMVATAGSGHAFKYLPNIGGWVVDIMEGVGLEREVVKKWRWRHLGEGETPYNRLMEGKGSERSLWNVPLVSADTEREVVG